jgi:hypothetical protein
MFLYQRGSHWTDFREISYRGLARNNSNINYSYRQTDTNVSLLKITFTDAYNCKLCYKLMHSHFHSYRQCKNECRLTVKGIKAYNVLPWHFLEESKDSYEKSVSIVTRL